MEYCEILESLKESLSILEVKWKIAVIKKTKTAGIIWIFVKRAALIKIPKIKNNGKAEENKPDPSIFFDLAK